MNRVIGALRSTAIKIRMVGSRLITALMTQASGLVTRSTVLNPPAWFVAICGTLALGGVYAKAPVYLTIIFATFFVLGSFAYIFGL